MKNRPTDSELEILQILWHSGSATVREVNERLSSSRAEEIGYTTTLKIMQIMYEKGMVNRDTSNRTHIYAAKVNPEQTRNTILDKVIDTVFNGSASQLVMQALSNRRSSPAEIEAIKTYLRELEDDGKS